MKYHENVILLLLGILLGMAQSHAQTVVQTAYGPVSGVADQQSSVVSFKGIPYAASPVGELRWRAPQAPASWKSVRKADQFGASCTQNISDEFLPWTYEFLTHNKTSEDCLFLNIWTPKVASAAKLPVIVFIHGGGFTGGAGDVAVYDGAHLAAKGVVLVTINYRLGVFGFLAHPELTAESEHHASGNYGLMDQIAALRWVMRNIGGFGGNPDNITIWGQSAGAFSVEALVNSPLTKGLFQRAMADSGLSVAGLPIKDLKTAEEAGVQFAAKHHAASIKELRALPAADLLPGPMEFGLSFSPVVDNYVLPATPVAINKAGAGNDVPVITGFQANDGLFFMFPVKSKADYEKTAANQFGELAPEFLSLYPVQTDAEVATQLAQYIRDRDRVAQYLWAAQRVRSHKQPVYTYFFTRAIPWPQHPEFGAFHTGEIPYFFLNLKMLDRPWEPIDDTVAQTASAYLLNYAKTGNPNGKGLPEWLAVAQDRQQTMEIGAHTGPLQLGEKDRVAFWVKYFNTDVSKSAPAF